MKWPTFDTVENKYDYSRREYEIDESSYEHRKYKEPVPLIRVYQHGLVSVRWNGTRDPAWRSTAHRTLGIRFILPTELVGMRLYNPDTGARVVRKAMATDPVFYDEERSRVYSVKRGNSLDFISPHAQPISSRGTEHWCDNKERYAAVMGKLQPYVEMGKAMTLLADGHDGVYFDWDARAKIADTDNYPPYPPVSRKDREFCMAVANCKPAVENAVRQRTGDTFTPNYLVVKPA